VRPTFGENICRDLACEYDGKRFEHGETWCAEVEGVSDVQKDEKPTNIEEENLPGSRYFRMLCYNGDVTVEPCADFRQEICLESEVNSFSAAACVVNRWQDCAQQTEKKDCENTDKRDCQWTKAGHKVKCSPKYPPGFDFWSLESQLEETCAQASSVCKVSYEKGLTGGWKCKSGCECLTKDWENAQNLVCSSLGDCGVKINFVGQEGFTNGSAVTTRDADEGGDSGGGGFLGF
jgi:hypothetical protein